MPNSSAVFKVLPHNPRSQSAKALAKVLDCHRLSHSGRWTVEEGNSHVQVINWGMSAEQANRDTNLGSRIIYINTLNNPNHVKTAAHKIRSFERLSEAELPTCQWTTDITTAQDWLEMEYGVVERHRVTGHSGQGIRLVRDYDEGLQRAPLYTRYINKRAEYRVHVFRGRVIDFQQKRRRLSHDNPNWQIRNHVNGWNFARTFSPEISDEVRSDIQLRAIQAVAAMALDFGAVDIVTSGTDKPYILEVNTAPGLEGTTLYAYADAFANHYVQANPAVVETDYFQALNERLDTMKEELNAVQS